MVGIAGDIAGRGAFHHAGSMREAVPDGFALAVFVPGAFDLIGSGGSSPDKFFGEFERGKTHLGFEKISNEAMAGRQNRKRCGGTKSGGEKFTAIVAIPSAHGLPPRREIPNSTGFYRAWKQIIHQQV